MSTNYFSVSWFQIENLLINRIYFLFIDMSLNEGPGELPPELRELRRVIPAERVVEEVQTLISSPDQPVILLCEDGKRSGPVAETLGALGLTNVFIVSGGAQDLINEYRSAKLN